jgi:hypothetical protein
VPKAILVQYLKYTRKAGTVENVRVGCSGEPILRPWPLFEECALFIPIFVFYHLQNLMHYKRFKMERQLASSKFPRSSKSIGRGTFGEVCKPNFDITFPHVALLNFKSDMVVRGQDSFHF